MTKDEGFKLLKIQTCVLRVNIHCDGCRQKVKKLLQRIEGVYQVNIDAEQQKVSVSGGVDADTLIKKLVKAGKHAELWSQKNSQNQKQKSNCIKDDKNNKGQKQGLVKGLEALKNQQKFPFYLPEGEDFLDDDEEEDDEEDKMRFLREKANQINLLRAIEGNNGKKNFGPMAAAAAPNNGKMNNNPGNANTGKKGNANQNMGMKGNPGGIDQKTMAALKMNNNAQLGVGNVNAGEAKMGNDINTTMNLAGFHGNGATNLAAVLGGNSTGNFHNQGPSANSGFMGSSAGGFPTAMASGNLHPSSMTMSTNGHQQYPSAMLMNLQNRHAMQQPQMMYNRSPFIPPSTGYYYNYGPVPYTNIYTADHYHSGDHSATHMFSDENTSSCSIM